MTRKNPAHTQLHGFAILLALFLAVPLNAYDDIQTSENSIRDAYFLGTGQGSRVTVHVRLARKDSRWDSLVDLHGD